MKRIEFPLRPHSNRCRRQLLWTEPLAEVPDVVWNAVFEIHVIERSAAVPGSGW